VSSAGLSSAAWTACFALASSRGKRCSSSGVTLGTSLVAGRERVDLRRRRHLALGEHVVIADERIPGRL